MNIVTLDTETTGPNPHEDKLVTLFMGEMTPQRVFTSQEDYLFNPGIEIPEGASAVHGITTEHSVKWGLPKDEHMDALLEIRQFLLENKGKPIVLFNASFDLTLLNLEFERNSIMPLNFDEFFIFDPFVIDKAVDKYRRGSRQLVDVARHYNVQVDETKTHQADYDCYLAGAVALALLQNPAYATFTKDMWMSKQKAWKQEQASSLESYLRQKKNDKSIVVNGEWPVQTSGEGN